MPVSTGHFHLGVITSDLFLLAVLVWVQYLMSLLLDVCVVGSAHQPVLNAHPGLCPGDMQIKNASC